MATFIILLGGSTNVFLLHTEHYTSLHKLMDEYIHYVIELLQAQAIEVQYNEVLRIPRSESHTLCLFVNLA